MLLQLIIGTYKRPKTAISSFKKLIAIRDAFPNDISIACSSNGIEDDLRIFCNSNDIIYHEFKTNQGGVQNGKYLVQNSNAKYCMALSDEDCISSSVELVGDFLCFLRSLPDNVGIISCSIGYEFDKTPYFQYLPEYQNFSYNLKDYFFLNMFIPSYISGLTINTSLVHEDNIIDLVWQDRLDNAYAHLSLPIIMLQTKKLAVYSKQIVLKGEDVKYGGDGYSHIKEKGLINNNNKDLNPLVYGPEARFKQFLYFDSIISSTNSIFFVKTHGRLRNMYAFLKSMQKCHQDVHGITRNDVKKLNTKIYKSILKNSQNNLIITLFYYISNLPLPLLVYSNKFMNYYFKVVRFFYFKIMKQVS